MSFGSVAYASYVRIRSETNDRAFPDWTELTRERRIAWEAAAQSVAIAVLPQLLKDESSECDEQFQMINQEANNV